MRRRLAPLAPLALLLVVAGCSDDSGGSGGSGDADPDGGPGGSGGSEPVDVADACAPLDDEVASALTGVAVTRKVEETLGGLTCTYYDGNDDGLVTVLVLARDGSFETLTDLVEGPADEVESEPLAIPGADEGLVVDDVTSNLAATQLLARDGEVAYTVYPTGLTREDDVRIGTAVLTVLLGGEPDAAAAVDRSEVPHPCEQLTTEEAAEALGVPQVSADRADGADGSVPLCLYEAPSLSVTLVDLGRTTRVDNAASPIGADDRGEEVTAPPPLTAYRPAETEPGTDELFVATDRTVLSLQLEGDGVADGRLAESLLPALVP